ncbi:PREDICTED: 17.8 kDa class I heat shock protein-like [Nelumbo nucifera]|uniref:17.8 kDa class I heat shock protein-like n=1 Tax=Nelumbo nucifera TaxID=4432 RepID=A0A1U7ZIT4_NELNU|nr:PREDICTED: 17.8 kDa class I heat shock protein-like [Nelumbo nucifera]
MVSRAHCLVQQPKRAINITNKIESKKANTDKQSGLAILSRSLGTDGTDSHVAWNLEMIIYGINAQNLHKFGGSTVSTLKATLSIIPSIFGGQRSNIFNPFSLDIWDRFEGFPFSTTISSAPDLARETSAFVNAHINWKETPKAHVFKAELPGLKKEEVKVEVEEGRVLQISGERSRENEEKSNKWHWVERSGGKFLRRFRLLENTKLDRVKASIENRVLTVTLPKQEEKKSEVKAIEISG